ncbi:MAG: hypothetical protein HQL32_04060 [Planctomycetes bacterium]|nr:hypothetical protein [Planctomycetota bacterium]
MAWSKGQSGNPKGRPRKEFCISTILDKVGDEMTTLDGIDLPKKEAVLRKVYTEALAGERWAIEFIADRTEGKPHQSVSQEVSGEMPIARIKRVMVDSRETTPVLPS